MTLSIVGILLISVFAVSYTNAKKLKEINIRKEVLIDGSLDKVYNQVVYLKNFPNWSPFLEADPSQKYEVKGTDGQAGAQYHWEGNKGKDLGYQEIKEIRPKEYIRMECDIQKPYEVNPVFEYSFKEVGGQTKVVQEFNMKSSKTDAFFMWVFGAKKDISRMNERGLELLKEYVEKEN